MIPIGEDLGAAISTANVQVFIPDVAGVVEFEGGTWSSLNSWQLTTVATELPASAPFAEARVLELRIGDGPPTSFSVWQAARFSAAELANPSVSGPLATPFGNGIANILRYGFGVPLGESTEPFVPCYHAGGLSFPFDSGRDDLFVLVESSDDLSDWSNPFILFDSTTEVAPAADGLGRITISDPRPAVVKRFYRVKVTLK